MAKMDKIDRQKRSNSYPTAAGFNAEQRKRNLPSVYYKNERNVKSLSTSRLKPTSPRQVMQRRSA